MSNSVFEEIDGLITEDKNPATANIDTKSIEEILYLINSEDEKVASAVKKEIPYICESIKIVVNAFNNGGRLFYVGAGTSGRLAVLDAAECPPTFGTDPEKVQGIIAGGYEALVTAQEGAEDDQEQGKKDLLHRGFCAKDVACGVAASRRTPYVVGAIGKAREIGGKTIYITCNPRKEMDIPVDVAICPVVGPEVIMGSTRMKAGTATKLVLNMITTTAMIRMGKVYGNLMVDLQMNSKKLEERSKKIVMMVTGVNYDMATQKLREARGHVKTAIVMLLANVERNEAKRRLEISNGFIREALKVK